MNHAGEWRLVISRWVGDTLPEQCRRGARRATLERDERSVAFGVRDGLVDHAPAGRDDPAGEHEIVVQREGFNRHAIGIFLFPGGA